MLIQIPRCLIKPKILRFLCFASSIVGLLCYALSSSFNHLFGKWTWWKIFLYICFCLIICFAILFAKTRQGSYSLRLKAHLAFLVLIITCLYSFFWDQVVKGKPDAYSLISCAAFAIMSLSLSRQSHCGVEIDLLYFFGGNLTVQLMKIKPWLVIVGGSFCYFLIILRSSLDISPLESVHLSFHVQDQVVIAVDSQETNTSSVIQVDSFEAHTVAGNRTNTSSAPLMVTFDDNQGNRTDIVSELVEGDSSRKIVEIICRTSWLKSENHCSWIERILKVHNMQETLVRFEEYRDMVKFKANKLRKKYPRCVADGNELLRFYGTTVSCSLGLNGSCSLCLSEKCCVCRIVRNGFSPKGPNQSVGFFTTSTSGRAFESIESFGDEPSLRKALIVCRVIAGMVHKPLLENTEEITFHSEFDSLAAKTGLYSNIEELYLLNPRALLPCFVVICKPLNHLF